MENTDNKIVFSIIESLPSLFYEFKDNEKVYIEKETSLKYKQLISPLFNQNVIDDVNNNELLSLIVSKVPYYYIEPTRMIEDTNGSPEEYILQDTRDCGINDVPSVLQNNVFWQAWFQHTWGYIYNKLILNIYNTLQYPYVNENLFLNNTLYTRLIKKMYNSNSSDGYISFIDTEEENDSVYDKNYDFYGEEVGCLDYIQDIVTQRINSEYFLIDYKDTSTSLLNKWGESLYASGQMNSEALDSAKLLYRLQDIRNELVRRKLAGSQTLYSMVIESIDRKGSFIPTLKESEMTNNLSASYNSNRRYKVLALPGINTQFVDYNSSSTTYGSLIGTYTINDESIPINTLIPLFYSSNNSGDSVFANSYDSDKFYNFSLDENFALDSISSENYRNSFLRDNLNLIDWNNLKSINLSDSVAVVYSVMDEASKDSDGKITYKNILDEKDSSADYITMDASSPWTSALISTSSVLDISADRVLYHRNSIQDSLDVDYPYVTYPVANGNGLSLIDTYWLNYIENEVEYKSRVQDRTELGVQLSIIKQFYSNETVIDHDFFAISYTNDSYKESKNSLRDIEIRDYKEGDRFALIWYCTISYAERNGSTEKPTKFFTKKLISVISITKNFDETQLSKYTDSDYNIYTSYNTGILPLTYSTAIDETLWKNYSGFYKNSEGNYDFIDDLTDSNYAVAMYAFANYSDLSSSILDGLNPAISGNTSLYSNNLCSRIPSAQTKAIFYITKRYDNNNNYHYYWSDAIKVISLEQFLKGIKNESTLDTKSIYELDSADLCFYINPYLNFTEESASPLRNSQVMKNTCLNTLTEEGTYDTEKFAYTKGVNKSSLLSSLITENTWLGNNLGQDTVKSEEDIYGYYLQKNNSFTDNLGTTYDFSYSYIQGDNRNIEGEKTLEKNYDTENYIYILYSNVIDTNNVDCITVTPYLISNNTSSNENAVSSLRGKIQTINIVPYKDVNSTDTSIKWDWKNSKDKSIFLEISFNSLSNGLLLTDKQIENYSFAGAKIALTSSDTLFVKQSDNTLYMYDPIEGIIKEHQMYIVSYDKMSLYITSKGKITLDLDGTQLTSTNTFIDWSKINTFGTINLGISLKEQEDGNTLVMFCINDEYLEETVASTNVISSYTKNYIPLFRKDDTLTDITTLFYGNLYSFRIYNRAMNSSSQMILTNSGTLRELYSLSPSNYKLAHTVYKDIAVMKENVTYSGDTTFPDITEIRLFTRGVWDSIMLDKEPKGILAENSYDPKDDTDIYTTTIENGEIKYYLNNCIEQELLSSESFNEYTKSVDFRFLESSGKDSVNIIYRDYDNPISLQANDTVAILNTLIEPQNYADEPINSGESIKFKFNTTDSSSLIQIVDEESEDILQYIRIPKTINSSDDTFTYSADTNFNFRVSPSMDMSRWITKGDNVELQCITKNNSPVTVAVLQDDNIFSTTKNNVVLPLVIPYQEDNKDIYLDKFYFKNVVLNSSLVSFLDATNYYTEIRIPVLTNYDVDIYTETKGMVLTETSDVTYNSNKKYYSINTYQSAIQPYYISNPSSIIYQQLGSSQDINTDLPVTEMKRGITYYKWDGSATQESFIFKDGYKKESLYFTLKVNSEGIKAYVPYYGATFDVDTTYYSSENILLDFTGTSFVSGSTYYEDNITSNTYYTRSGEVYSLYSSDSNTTFSSLSSDTILYKKSTTTAVNYINKWDALRTLKTGTYYFTCKYPLQITPFMDSVYNGDSDHMYTTYYASSRFKIEVKQTPYLMESSEYAIDGTPANYRSNSIINTIKSSSNRFSPDDNETFPHMKVDIDMYVLDCDGIAGQMNSDDTEAYNFKWVLVASNNKEEKGVISLTKNTIQDTVILTKEIPMFFEKSYTSSFFVASREKLADGTYKESPSSADDDIICPITIIGDYLKSRDKENIHTYTEKDMDNQILVAGKSYKIVFDYTGKVSEISFTDECYDNSSKMEASEKINYSRLINLVDSDFLNVSDFMYDSDGRSFSLVGNINVLNRTSGYKLLQDNNGVCTWEQDSFSTVVNENDTFAFGNPYSRASSLNYRLYSKNNSSEFDSRSNINNSYTYPYMVTENTQGLIIPSYSTRLNVLSENNTISEITFDESSILLSHYNEVKNSILSNVSSLKSKSSGLFSGFSTIEPNFNGISETTNKNIAINNETYTMYGYYSSSRQLPIGNENLTITRKSLYSNNLLNNSTFDNTNYWIINEGATNWGYKYIYNNTISGFGTDWEADTLWDDGIGKDVFKIINKVSYGQSIITLKYNGGSIGLNSIFESAINIKPILGTISKVQASLYYNNKLWKTIDLTATELSDGWINYGGNTINSDSCDSVTFIITFAEAIGACYITKAVIRKCNTTSHKLGFSDALNEVDLSSKTAYVSLSGQNVVLYKYPDTKESNTYTRIFPDEYFPIQFNNTFYETVSNGGKIIYRPKSGAYRIGEFISNNKKVSSIDSDSRIIELINPFIRRIYISKNDSNVNIITHRYKMYPNSLGVYEKEEIYSSTYDIITKMSSSDVQITESQDNKYFLIKFNRIPLSLTDLKEFLQYNVNLEIDNENPIELSNEKFTVLYNSFAPSMYHKGKDYSVVVTNIQLLGRTANGEKKIYYEFEFLPIIYSELKNHLSFNLLMYQKN